MRLIDADEKNWLSERNFSEEETAAYNDMLERLSVETGVNVLDMYEKKGETMGNYAVEAVEEARKEGQKQAWKLAQKILLTEDNGGFGSQELDRIFGDTDVYTILTENTYGEAAVSVMEWENRIKIGDVVKSIRKPDDYGDMVVVDILDKPCYDRYTIRTINAKFFLDWFTPEQIEKTGRALPIEDWVRQIGGEDNE